MGILSPPINDIKEFVINLNTILRGKISLEKRCIGYAKNLEMTSALWTATVFGVTSPNMSKRIVVTPTAIPTPLLPRRAVAKEATRLAEATFTNILPTRMVMSNLRGLPKSLATTDPLLPYPCRSLSTWVLLRDKSEASDPEKKADRDSEIPKPTK
jgi:hypothetical protein